MSIARMVSAKTNRRGRPTIAPTTQSGIFLQKKLDELRLTRRSLAKRLGVSSSTVGRLLNGDTRVVQRISAEAICEALGLDEVQRRDFLKIIGAAGAGTFALPTGADAPRTVKYKVDLDLLNDYADSLQHLINKGEAQYVMEKAQHWYHTLLQEPPYVKDTRLAETQIRFGILFGASQEFVFPWYQRGHTAIRTYNHIENNVICRFNLDTFRHLYANLLSHRAPLYREIGQFEESARQFEDGIYWLRYVDDPLLRANLFRSRIHVRAVQGDALQWARELEEARRDALQTGNVFYEELIGLLDYVEGEGYKRLAFNIHRVPPEQMRTEYARRALYSLAQSRSKTAWYPRAHHMLTQISEAQCLVWLDPEEATRIAEQLHVEAIVAYPALLAKINRTLLFARERMQLRPGDEPLLFNLDVHK